MPCLLQPPVSPRAAKRLPARRAPADGAAPSQHRTQPGCVRANRVKGSPKGAGQNLVACKAIKHPHWLRLWLQQPVPSPEPERGQRVPEVPALHHAGDWAKLMVCPGGDGALLEKLRCIRAQSEKRTPEGWLEAAFTGLASCRHSYSYAELSRSRKMC